MGIRNTILLTGFTLLFPSLICRSQSNQIFIGGHECVDMGLSVYWATCNVGSETPEESGAYFAWGETYDKSSYNDVTYRYKGELNKYWDYTKYKGGDYDSTLELSDDSAREIWGKPWRMPSKQEVDELIESCDWKFGAINGVDGCWAKSEITGNSLFFPLTGCFKDYYLICSGTFGYYWTSELRKDFINESYILWITYDLNVSSGETVKVPNIKSHPDYREKGCTIRAVCNK